MNNDMNHITWTKKGDSAETKVELELSDEIHDEVMNVMKSELLIPILHGERKELPGGLTYYCFSLPNKDAEVMKQGFLQAFAKVSGYDTPN